MIRNYLYALATILIFSMRISNSLKFLRHKKKATTISSTDDLNFHLPTTSYSQSRSNLLLSKQILLSFVISSFTLSKQAVAAERSMPHISTETIQKVIDETRLNIDEDIFTSPNFQRLDESPDSIFYTNPRLVEHIDANAVKSLILFHKLQLSDLSKVLSKPISEINILDVCSSWTSHLPIDIFEYNSVEPVSIGSNNDKLLPSLTTNKPLIVGIGMNQMELKNNRQLNYYEVKDLNVSPTLNIPNSLKFQLVLLQLSIDYLTNPVAVLEEIAKHMQTGGRLIIRYYRNVL